MEKESDMTFESVESKLLKLRSEIHKQMANELKERQEKNPIPAEEEIYLGAFREQIEPQVRDAVFELLKKGYELSSSGFGGIRVGEEEPAQQHIRGFFTLDDETKEKLAKDDVNVKTRYGVKNPGEEFFYYPKTPQTTIYFRCNTDDPKKIKNRWDQIASQLPHIHDKMTPSRGGLSCLFRSHYAPNRIDIKIYDYERRLIEEALPEDVARRIKLKLGALRLKQELVEDLPTDARKAKEEELKRLNNMIDKEQEETEKDPRYWEE